MATPSRLARRCGPVGMCALVLATSAIARADGPRGASLPTPAPPGARPIAAPSGASPEPEDGPFEVRLSIENDNLLLGTYGRLAGPDFDGNDLGRTHALALRFGYDVADRVRFELDGSTALFTRSVDGEEPGRGMIVPIHFHELSRFRLGVGLERPDAPWRVRFGLGLDVSNRDALVALGASGQQDAWHRLLRDGMGTETWVYEYVPDGAGVRVGGATDVRAGGLAIVELAAWSWLEIEGDVAGRLGSLPGASWLETRGRVAAGLGRRRGVRLLVGVEQHAYVWLETSGVMVQSTIDAQLDFQVLAVQVALNRYDLDQNRRYFVYVFDNTTMTVALWARF